MFAIEAWQADFIRSLIAIIQDPDPQADRTVGAVINFTEVQYREEVREILRLPGASDVDPDRPVKNYDLYSAIVQFISEKVEGTTVARRIESGDGFAAPADGVDAFLWTFLQGAWATNLSANRDAGDEALQSAEIPTAGKILGAAGAGYNNFQYEIRTGFDPETETSTLSGATASKTAQLDYGIATLARCFEGVPDGVQRAAHMCCGYPNHLDDHDYLKADPAAYLKIAEAVDGTVDAISIEDAHRHNPAELFERFSASRLIVGFVRIASSEVESVAQIAARMQDVMAHVPAERLIAAPDCGLGFLGRDLAMTKLRNMCDAARQV